MITLTVQGVRDFVLNMNESRVRVLSLVPTVTNITLSRSGLNDLINQLLDIAVECEPIQVSSASPSIEDFEVEPSAGGQEDEGDFDMAGL